MRYKTIYFDLDGTLTDSGPGIMNAATYALEAMGRPVPPREALRRYIGPPLVESFQSFECMELEEARRAVALFREYYVDRGKFENEPYPGMAALLETLKKRGKILIVATSKPEVTAVEILNHFNLARYFTRIAGATTDESRITKAQVLAYALAQGGKEGAVMVGDRRHDVEGARENGLPCVGVLFGYGSREELEEAGAARIAPTVAELLKILEE